MTHPISLDDLLRRSCLAFNARALHASSEAGQHAAAFVNNVADDALEAMDASPEATVGEYLAEAYRCLHIAAYNPMRQSCQERENLLNIACHCLGHAFLHRKTGFPAREEEVHTLLSEHWTASLLAWAEIFPPHLDATSPPCACGALGTRHASAPVSGALPIGG